MPAEFIPGCAIGDLDDNDDADFKDDYGLVSRGNDTRLQRDPDTQQRYFTLLQRRYLAACADAPGVDALRRTFQTLTIGTQHGVDQDDGSDEDAARRMALDHVVLGLRKLREAVIASGPPTPFAKKVLLFSVRVTVLLGHYQSYLPAMKRLLDDVHPVIPLSSAERHEIGGLYVLHLVHFSNDLTAAYDAMQQYDLFDDLALRQILRAWADFDYALWRRRYHAEPDSGRRRIMAFGDRTMAVETLKRLGTAYFFMQKDEIERLTGWRWTDCVEKLGCGWRLEETGRVVMRERKHRPQAKAA
ncbi:hypothetical protein POJ06DRAFT_237052 [Lipomyces tetrasporus]|uniref:CSN8/PSMD8/EIF3K domain-containing protein n=1 Tax=Lipomyces tetrasporus TaxID=54092 RepID=A0AAD7QSU4_9ASCO|nr:uncharacterized protein POJ06DRAFT_237052 [Lipomyces tetrasporus]KAJ8100887.1 hypothetical protein POJ06DRAFT_237052 [Lipomyces tetrasporus]